LHNHPQELYGTSYAYEAIDMRKSSSVEQFLSFAEYCERKAQEAGPAVDHNA
jgi:hypothetical protein